MIYYELGWSSLFKIKGSVFPKASKAAGPCALVAAAIRWAINEGYLAVLQADNSILTQTQAWAGFSVLVGFLIIFRSSQAYSRFWDGCTATHHMRADWFDAASALVAFTQTSKAPKEQVARFKHTVIRLISMMHSAAFMDLEEMNNKWGTTSDVKADIYELLDPLGIDAESLDTLYHSTDRVMLIFQWLQLLIVHNMEAGVLSVPAPILSRAYQELANGMVAFHECVKISDTPFPFPYAQNCDFLLLLHWALVPFVVSQWVTQPFWAFIFVFMQVFVLWSLNCIAVEIENPFGTDDNAIDGQHMQEDMNRHLLMLVRPKTFKLPELSEKAIFSISPEELDWAQGSNSFNSIWKKRRRSEKKQARKRYYDDKVREPGDAEGRPPPAGEGRLPADAGLRREAHASGGAPGEPSGCGSPTPCAPTAGLQGSWGALLEEGGAHGLRPSGGPRVYDAGPGRPADGLRPAMGAERWEPVPEQQWQERPPSARGGNNRRSGGPRGRASAQGRRDSDGSSDEERPRKGPSRARSSHTLGSRGKSKSRWF